MIRTAWHSQAKRELFEAQDFYEGRVRGLGEAFLDRIEAAVSRIRHYPRSGPPVGGGIRFLKVPQFPYGLIYRLEEERVYILAVAHHARRPRYWTRRI